MVRHTTVAPTTHYLEHHADDVPWDKVLELIATTKNARKKGDKYEIEQDGYYILFEVIEGTLFIINAKRT